MAKKIQIELDARNEKAKRKAKEVGEAAKAGMNEAADASERLSRNLDKASDGFRLSAKQMASVAASMGGMLVGTAAKAVALSQPEGSKAQTALDWGGSALQGAGTGAALGSVFGPLGTAIGGLAGAINGLLNKWLDDETAEKNNAQAAKEANAANRELYESMIAAQERTDAFRQTIDSLGDKEKSLGERQKELAAEIEKRAKEEERLKGGLQGNSSAGADEGGRKLFSQQMKEYAANHAELERLRSIQKSMDAESKKGTPAAERVSFSALDSLARVGGNFAGSEQGFRDLQRVNEKQVALLEKIEAKTGKGHGTF